MAEQVVRERPINFTPEQVRATLAGRKTQHRVVIKPQPDYFEDVWKCWFWPRGRGVYDMNQQREETTDRTTGKTTVREYVVPVQEWLASHQRCPFKVGMNLWVREAWQEVWETYDGQRQLSVPDAACKHFVEYAATVNDGQHPPRWRP